jgi:hypothetical protein
MRYKFHPMNPNSNAIVATVEIKTLLTVETLTPKHNDKRG